MDKPVLTTDVDWSLKGFFVFFILGALSAFLVGLTIKGFNSAPSFAGVSAAALAALFFFLVLIFQTFLIKSIQLNLYLALVEALTILVLFLPSLTKLVVIGAALFVISLVAGHFKARQDLTDRLKLRFGRFSRIVIASAVTGFALFAAFFYAGVYQQSDGVSFEAFQFLTKGSAPIVRSFVPGYRPDMTVDDFLFNLAKEQFGDSKELAKLSESQRQEVFRGLANEFKTRVALATKTAVEAREGVLSYFYRVSNRYLKEWASGRAVYLPVIIIIFLIYWLIKGVMFFLKWIVVGLGFLIYRALISLGLIYLTVESRNKEIIMLKSNRERSE